MGKHSLGDTTVFWRSLALATVRWLAIAAIPLLILFGLYRWFIQPEPETQPAEGTTPTESAEPATLPTATASPSPAQTLPATQVLKGTANVAFFEAAKSKVSRAGYPLATSGATSKPYEKTTVFYQPTFEAAARSLAELTGATTVEPAPATLSKQIPLTLVAGDDWQS
ncbi:MAG: LytR C-terminal domain-containing protein [Actinomycetota bacterium]